MKNIAPIAAAAGAAILFAFSLATCSRPKYPNPPVVHTGSMPKAYLQALEKATNSGGRVVSFQGSSMEPTIEDSGYSVIQKQPSIAQGDVLLYIGRVNRPDKQTEIIQHRAVEHVSAGWVMQGDANPWAEVWDPLSGVEDPRYLGTVVAVFEP